MSQIRQPFNTPQVRIRGSMSCRYMPQNDQAMDRAVEEILDQPEMQLLVDLLAPPPAPIKRGRGRPRSIDARFYLVWMVVAIVLALDARAARNRLLTRNRLRALVGLEPLSNTRLAESGELTDGDFDDPKAPSPARCRDFIREMVQEGGCYESFVPLVRRCMLMVAGAAIDDHNLPVDWVGGDGKRVLAATNKPTGPLGDSGTEVWSRDGEAPFNLRYHFHVTSGTGIPFIFVSHLHPPQAEITTLEDEVGPRLAEASAFLAEFITQRRLARGIDPTAAQHPGLRRSAFAIDTVLQSPRGLSIIRATGLWPAARHPDFNPKATAKTITVRRTRDQRYIKLKLRCRNITCINQTVISVPLIGPDRNDYAPTTSASKGEAGATAVNELPIWDAHYIAFRHHTLNTVEWVHNQMERLFKLGSKNRTHDRRKTLGHDANVVWWAMGSLIWNLTMRLNLENGRCTTAPFTLEASVAAAKKRSGTIKGKRAKKKRRRTELMSGAVNKEVLRVLRSITPRTETREDGAIVLTIDASQLAALNGS
jgi:hypothetical protein